MFVDKQHQLRWLLNGGASEMNALQPLAAKVQGGATSGRKASESGRLLEAAALGGAKAHRMAAEFRAAPPPDELAANLEAVKAGVHQALRSLYERDGGLLVRDVAERAVAGRLAVHLASAFPGRDVDVEYNRHGLDPKAVDLPHECGGAGQRIFPDVVVHRRGDDEANLLVVELKKTTNREPRECDRAKVVAMKAQLRYSHGVVIEVPAGPGALERPSIEEWI